jgi:hypothetical protein
MFLMGFASSWLTLSGYFDTSVNAGCPPTYHNGWAADSFVTYSAAFTGTELTNINTAMSNWHSHNTVNGTVQMSILRQGLLGVTP